MLAISHWTFVNPKKNCCNKIVDKPQTSLPKSGKLLIDYKKVIREMRDRTKNLFNCSQIRLFCTK